MQQAEGIYKAIFDVLVHPRTFNRQESADVLVFLGAGDIDFLMAGIVIAERHHVLAIANPALAVFEEGVVKAKLVVQAIVALATVGKINAIENPVREYELEHAAFFVRGVITQINEKSKVVYLSIADFEEGNVNPLATVPLYCFAAKFAAIRAKVENYPQPFELKEQLKVSFLIKADLYVPYGKLQAQILDIDPVYTLGELALTKSAILKRLALEGLLEKNKALALADVPVRVGLITGEGTAAYKDFTTKLAESPFSFKVKTAYAKMQGSETESTSILLSFTL